MRRERWRVLRSAWESLLGGLATAPGGWVVLLLLLLEAVAEAEVGVDEAVAGEGGVELLAELGDVDVDGAVGLAVGLVPDGVVELLAADDSALTLDERGDEVELAGGQVERAALDEHEELRGPDLDRSGSQSLGVGRSFHAVEGRICAETSRYVRVIGL